MLWPVHCIVPSDAAKRSDGNSAQLLKTLKFKKAVTIIKKGFNPNLDAYSAAQGIVDTQAGEIKDGQVELKWENTPAVMTTEAAKDTAVTLQKWMANNKITTLFQTGIATDYCVQSTAADSSAFETVPNQLLMADAMVGVAFPPGSLKNAVDAMAALPSAEWAQKSESGDQVCVGIEPADALKLQQAFKDTPKSVGAAPGATPSSAPVATAKVETAPLSKKAKKMNPA